MKIETFAYVLPRSEDGKEKELLQKLGLEVVTHEDGLYEVKNSGADIFMSERGMPGVVLYTKETPPKVLGGVDGEEADEGIIFELGGGFWLEIRKIEADEEDEEAEDDMQVGWLGPIGEMSVLVEELDTMGSVWQALEFEKVWGEEGKAECYRKGGLQVGMYTPAVINHSFESPTLTWFMADSKEKIERVKSLGLEIKEEIPNKDGEIKDAVLELVEGHDLFLFWNGQ